MTRHLLACAASTAASTLAELPLVDIASSTSPGRAERLDLLGEDDVVAVVVADRGEDRGVDGQRDRRQARPLALEAADELGREMLRVGGRAAVAAGQHLAAAGDAADERADRVGDRLGRALRRRRTSGRRCRRTAAGFVVRAWSRDDMTRISRRGSPRRHRRRRAATRCDRRRRDDVEPARRRRCQRRRKWLAAKTRRRRLAAPTLAAAPPKRPSRRARTSTKTSVPSRSRMIRSISPPRAPRAARDPIIALAPAPARARPDGRAPALRRHRRALCVVALASSPGAVRRRSEAVGRIDRCSSQAAAAAAGGQQYPAAGALRGRHADRQPRRHHAARAARARSGRRHRLRGHAAQRRAAAPLRPRQAAARAARAQRARRRRRRCCARLAARRARRLHQRRRHAGASAIRARRWSRRCAPPAIAWCRCRARAARSRRCASPATRPRAASPSSASCRARRRSAPPRSARLSDARRRRRSVRGAASHRGAGRRAGARPAPSAHASTALPRADQAVRDSRDAAGAAAGWLAPTRIARGEFVLVLHALPRDAEPPAARRVLVPCSPPAAEAGRRAGRRDRGAPRNRSTRGRCAEARPPKTGRRAATASARPARRASARGCSCWRGSACGAAAALLAVTVPSALSRPRRGDARLLLVEAVRLLGVSWPKRRRRRCAPADCFARSTRGVTGAVAAKAPSEAMASVRRWRDASLFMVSPVGLSSMNGLRARRLQRHGNGPPTPRP